MIIVSEISKDISKADLGLYLNIQGLQKRKEGNRGMEKGNGYHKAVLAEWLGGFPWSVFHTGTFDGSGSRTECAATKDSFTAKRRFLRFRNEVEKKLKLNHGVDYAMACEPHKSGLIHVHALMNFRGIGENFDRRMTEHMWKIWFDLYGRNTVVAYEKEKGAEYYMTKYTTKGIGDRGDWDIEIRPVNQSRLIECAV